MGNQWLFPDGKVLPVVSGGSDEGDLDLPMGFPSLGNEEPSSEPQFSEFAQGILNQIPEEDRGVVSRYISTWDGNVTKQFQKIHEQYKPYKELGPVDDLRDAFEFIQLLNEDPLRFYNSVTAALREHGMLGNDDDYDQGNGYPEFDGLPDQFVKQFQTMEQRLAQFESQFGEFQQSLTQKEQIAQVDNLLKTLHNEHGDFDEEYILSKLANGYSPEDAINSWNKLVEKYQQPKKSAPNLIPGAGAVPSGQVDLSKMPHDEKLKYLANRIAQANG